MIRYFQYCMVWWLSFFISLSTAIVSCFNNKTEQKQGDGRADESAPASESREVHHG